MGRWGRSEGPHTKYMGLGSSDLSYILYGGFSHMGLGSLIHFVWGFLSYILYGDLFHSWSSKVPLSTPLIEPSPSTGYPVPGKYPVPGHQDRTQVIIL